LIIQYNLISQVINDHTDSQYRATTLSTFNLLSNLPYVLTAFIIGKTIDSFSALTFTYYLGILTLMIVGYQLLIFILHKNLFNKYIANKLS
jgi:hypothetical protein